MFSNPEVEDKTNTKKGGGNWLDDLVKSLFGFNTAEAAGPDGKPVVGMSIVIDKIDVSKLISDSGTAGTKIVQTFQNMADKVGAVFINIVSGWAVATSGMAEMSQAGAQSTVQNFSSMMDKTFAVFEGIATGWSIVCNSMGANAQSANKQVIKAFSDMWKKATSIFKSLASNWSKMMNSMISNAKSAAKGVNNALDSIKKEVVTVHRIVTQGSMAKGGIISAAGGMMTTAGPRTVLIGDNPGGKETIVAIPHNNPWKWVDMVNSMFPGRDSGQGIRGLSGGYGGGSGDEFHIHNHFIDREVLQSFKRENGRLRSRYGPTGIN